MSPEDISLLSQVGEQFLCHAQEPRNLGCLDNSNGSGTAIGQCGDSIDVSLRIDAGTIADIGVSPHGCVYTLVCASAMSELARGRNVDHALELAPEEVAATLGGLPEDHMHCARLAVNSLGEAIADYYKTVSNPE